MIRKVITVMSLPRNLYLRIRLTVSTLKQHGICSLLTTPENLSVDVINKYLEMKSRNQI